MNAVSAATVTNPPHVTARVIFPASRELPVWPGQPAPLGATCRNGGVNFALFSDHATKVELCLFRSPDATAESHRSSPCRRRRDQGLARLICRTLGQDQIYGYHGGPNDEPSRGNIDFNPNKVLLDPYAKQIARELIWDDAILDPEA